MAQQIPGEACRRVGGKCHQGKAVYVRERITASGATTLGTDIAGPSGSGLGAGQYRLTDGCEAVQRLAVVRETRPGEATMVFF